MLRPLLALLLTLTACSGQTSATAPVDAPAAAPADDAAPAAPTPAEPDDGAGFADPKAGADPAPAKPSEPVDPALATRIRERFGADCKLERRCGELLGVDCKAAVDGPYYYVQSGDLKTVATCGGACMGGRCTDCPPKAWTCPVY